MTALSRSVYTDLLDKASHLTEFSALDSSPHLLVTLMRCGIGKNTSCTVSDLHNIYRPIFREDLIGSLCMLYVVARHFPIVDHIANLSYKFINIKNCFSLEYFYRHELDDYMNEFMTLILEKYKIRCWLRCILVHNFKCIHTNA